MSAIEKISIALPHELVPIVREAVETGEYASSSDVTRCSPRLDPQAELASTRD